MATTTRVPPRRGGEHPTYGLYIGGSFLDDQYKLSGTRNYQYTSQRRSPKVVNSIEQALSTTIESKSAPKFNGNLEKTPSSKESELEKLTFIKHLKRKVQRHGQQSLYAVEYQNEVLSLFEHYHKFTVDEVIAQYELRCNESAPILDPTTGIETEASKQMRFQAYDEYEFDEFGLSRLVVESLLSSELLERMYTKFGNDADYETYPGQILFIMALDTCNASVQRDIAGAQAKFDQLTLDTYPGEDVTELATEALRLIHILSGSYALPLNLGSTLIKKVTATSSEFFNRKMFSLLDSARTLENNYRLKDPITMGDDPLYTQFGPYAICEALQEEHGRLIADSDWPALATKLPESNTATVPVENGTQKQIQCFKCKQWGHKANDPICPLYSKKTQSRSGQESSTDRRAKPKDPWKYVEPRNLTQPVVIDDKQWYFCTKCKCRATGKVGFYQLSHTDATHDPNWSPEGNASPITDPDPTPVPPHRPPDDSPPPDDDLVFTGIHHAPVVSSLLSDERETAEEAAAGERIRQWATGRAAYTTVGPPVVHTMDTTHNSINEMEFPQKFLANFVTPDCIPCEVDTTATAPVHTSDYLLHSFVWTNFLWLVCIVTAGVRSLITDVCAFLCCQYNLCRTKVLTGCFCCGSPWVTILTAIVQGVNYHLKYYVLLGTSCGWYICRTYRNLFTDASSRNRGTKIIRFSFPAKWLIFSAFMLNAQVCGGQYFSLHWMTNNILTKIIIRHLSICTVISQPQCTWDFLLDYNLDQLTDLTNILQPNVFDGLQPPEASISQQASNYQQENQLVTTKNAAKPNVDGLYLDFSSNITHSIDVTKNQSSDKVVENNAAPAVSSKAGLELFNSMDLQVNLTGNNSSPIIFDTGASLAITGDATDFLPNTFQEVSSLKLGGMAAGAPITGVGNVSWTLPCDNGDQMAIITKCYLVPSATTRLLSPQQIFDKSNGNPGKFWGDEDQFHLEYLNKPTISVDYSSNSNLPIGYALTTSSESSTQVNLTLLDENNQNLTAGQKLLLEYHYRFGHTNMPLVQQILRSNAFPAGKFAAATKCAIPKCAICEFAKQHRRSTKGTTHTPTTVRDGSLKVNDLKPGSTISVDHFESRLKGRTFDSYGKATSDKYIGGCIFVDHASGYVHVEFQLGFSAVETIRAKQNFEKFAFNNGVIPISHLTDSGAFKANKFVQHFRNHNQKIQYCGTNAHHQNGVAERAIRTISSMARAMLLHASAHWKHGIDASMWPMAVQYSTYVYNILPRSNNISPCDLFFGSTVPRHKLANMHVWGCPVYVLSPTLQSGNKIPRWEPRSKRGVFCGLSTIHSSEVPQVLNLTTGSITTQFHVVFDDLFTTVTSVEREEDPPSHWNDLCLEQTELIPVDTPLPLSPEWLSESDTAQDSMTAVRSNRVREDLHESGSTTPSNVEQLFLPTPSSASPQVLHPPQSNSEGGSNAGPNSEGVPTTATRVIPSSVETAQDLSRPEPPASAPPPSVPSPSSSPGVRRSARSNKGQYTSTRYINEVFLSAVHHMPSLESYHGALLYQAELETDMPTFTTEITDPRVYNAKFYKKPVDPDAPTFRMAMAGQDADKYIEAMKEEVSNLKRMNTWILVDREPHMKVLKGTWAFKLKRTPDGVAYRHRSRFCVRGDQQEYGVNYFETYAPVVQWSTIRILLILILTNRWNTRVIDYTNAFPQANIDTDIYVEPPALFGSRNGEDKVLKLIKSLYGLKQSPRTFYQHLSKSLQNRGWTVSEIDPCLFMKNNMICVIYVDDTIFAGPNQTMIDQEVQKLGIKHSNEEQPLEFRDEGELSAFLGIKIEHKGTNEYYLSQPGLISKVLKAAGMDECNPNSTPSTLDPLGPDKEGQPMDESWEYASIVGMLMYLANNTRPDIAHAVHACARYTHQPKKSHATAIKHILRYLKGTMDKGMVIKPNSLDELNCYVDSDFAGLYPVYPDQDPSSTKSRTGYVIFYQGCPVLWVSKMQTQCALSTMESEYLALSQSMRDLIPLREILKEINKHVFNKSVQTPRCVANSKSFSDIVSHESDETIPPSKVYEDNHACLKFARLPRLTPRTKHIAVPYHWFRSKVEQLEIVIEPISTEKQLADQFTKPLSLDKFLIARKDLMGW